METLTEKYHSPSTLHNMLGVMLNRMNRTEAAIAEYRRAIELDPYCAEAYLNWGALHFSQNKLNEALCEWETVLKLDPYNQNAKHNIAVLKQTAARKGIRLGAGDAVTVKSPLPETPTRSASLPAATSSFACVRRTRG